MLMIGSVSPQSLLTLSSPSSPSSSFSRRLFSRSGIHEVEGPNLGSIIRRPVVDEKSASAFLSPPAGHDRRLRPIRRNSRRSHTSSFFPTSGSTSVATPFHQQEQQPIVRHSRRRLPPDYNSDIITINDIMNEGRPKGSSSSSNKNNEWIRTVGTSIQVTPDANRSVRGKVFDDVIFSSPSHHMQ